MKFSFKLTALLLLSALVFTGCPKKMQPPTAADTLGGTGANANWAAPSDMGDAGAGLSERNGGIDADLMSRIKNGALNPEDIVCTVYFDFDQYGVRAAERAKLADAASAVQSGGLSVVAVGYTDWYGTEQYNLALSERRARAVQDYLATLGVPEARVALLPMGKMQAVPNVDKHSPEAAQDRRVHLVKSSGGSAASPSTLDL